MLVDLLLVVKLLQLLGPLKVLILNRHRFTSLRITLRCTTRQDGVGLVAVSWKSNRRLGSSLAAEIVRLRSTVGDR